jgi:hypothetical protein
MSPGELAILELLYPAVEPVDLLALMEKADLDFPRVFDDLNLLIGDGLVDISEQPLGNGTYLRVYRITDEQRAARLLGFHIAPPGALSRPSALAAGKHMSARRALACATVAV